MCACMCACVGESGLELVRGRGELEVGGVEAKDGSVCERGVLFVGECRSFVVVVGCVCLERVCAAMWSSGMILA